MSTFDHTTDAVLSAAGVSLSGDLKAALDARQDIFDLTAVTQMAAIKPKDPGGLSHDFRAALAARMAHLNNDMQMAAYFVELISDTATVGRITDPGVDGSGNARLAALLRHTDMVTTRPKDAVRGDIEALQAAGVGDADIVRLSELIAFVSYQLRVAAGLRLISGQS